MWFWVTGREKQVGWWHMDHFPLLSATVLLQAHCHDTKNCLSWLLQEHLNTYLLIATQNIVLFCCWWKMHPSSLWGLTLSRWHRKKHKFTSVKLAGCLQSALARQSENLEVSIRRAGDWLICVCWFLAHYCLASKACLQDFCPQQAVSSTSCSLSLHWYFPRRDLPSLTKKS